ncbi:MAG TPA: hypothetical protein VGK59_09380 [Ohtaekwangia sp.]
MTDPHKPAKLIYKLRSLTLRLNEQKDLIIHQRISQFYYMEKITELNELCDQLSEATRRMAFLRDQLDRECIAVFSQWRHDIRWLNHHLAIRDDIQPANTTTLPSQP